MKFKDMTIALISGSNFILLLFKFRINLVVAIILTLLMFIGLSIIFSDKQRTLRTTDQKIIERIDNNTLRDCLNDSRFRINEIWNHIDELNGEVKDKVERICYISEQIFDRTITEPSNIRVVKKKFSYYLDAVDKILSSYTELSEQEVNSNEISIRLNKVEKTLDEVILVFEMYLEDSFQNKLFNLDIEIELLQDTMRMEMKI